MSQMTPGMKTSMTFGSNNALRLVILLAAAGFAALPARAGAMELTWDPVASSDLSGYRVYYDTPPGGSYGSFVDVGPVTSYTLSGLSDCALYHVAIKARDAAGELSPDYSNEVVGYAHPEVASAVPNSVARGQTLEIAINGASFAPGALAQLTNVTVNTAHIDSCGRMTVQISIPASGPDSSDITVVNSDGGYTVLQNALQLTSTTASLAVESVTPATGSDHIDPGQSIEVQFNKPLNPGSVTAARFKILKQGGAAARIQAGFPSLDASGTRVTLRVAGTLEAGASYSVVVKGGRAGVAATDGQKLAADHVQSPGFSTESLLQGAFYAAETTLVPAPPLQSLVPGVEIPVSSTFSIQFSETLSLVSVTQANFRVMAGTRRVALAAGFPSLSSDGLSVILDPASPLPAGTAIQIIIKGGPTGVKSTRGVIMFQRKIVIATNTAADTVQGLGVAE